MSFSEQADLVFENLRVCLESAGAGMYVQTSLFLPGFCCLPLYSKDIIKLTFYIVDIPRNRGMFSVPLQRFLTDEDGTTWRPPSSLVGVASLSVPEWLVEVEATAVIPPPLPTTPEPALSTLFSSFPLASTSSDSTSNPTPTPNPTTTPSQTSSSRPAPSPPPTSGDNIRSVDVIVIGAGLSGLQAALDIQKAGLSCIVLEARDRVGGKVLTLPVKTGKGNEEREGWVDVGAAWFNPTTQPRIAELVRRLRGESVVQNVEGEKVIELEVEGKAKGRGVRYGDGKAVPVSATFLFLNWGGWINGYWTLMLIKRSTQPSSQT